MKYSKSGRPAHGPGKAAHMKTRAVGGPVYTVSTNRMGWMGHGKMKSARGNSKVKTPADRPC